MAYVKEEEDTGQPGINDPAPETPTTGVSGAPLPTTGTQPAAGAVSGSVAPKPAATSGTYTNLQEYTEQNRPAATQMSGQVTQKTETQAADIGQQVQQQQSDFMKKVAENRARLQQAGTQAQEQIQQAGQQDYSPEDIQRTQQLAQGQYQLDQAGLDVAAQQREAQKLAAPAQSAQTQQGRLDLLRKTFGDQGKQYTRGQQSLDELVLAGSEQARRQMAEAPKAAAAGLQEQISQARRQALQETGGLEVERRQMQEQTAADLAAAQTGLQTTLEERLGATPDVLKQIQEGTLTQEAIDALGLDGGKLYGVDPLAYLKQASLSGISTQEDLARAQALASLGGTTQQIIADPTAVGQQDVRGMEALREAIAGGKTAYETALVDPTQQLEMSQRLAEMGKTALQKDVRGVSTWDDEQRLAKAGMYSGDFGNIWNQMRGELGGAYSPQEMAMSKALFEAQRYAKLGDQGVTGLDLAAFDRMSDPYTQQLAALEKQYGNVLTAAEPVVAADGAVKRDPRMESLRKLLRR